MRRHSKVGIKGGTENLILSDSGMAVPAILTDLSPDRIATDLFGLRAMP